ncbi:MAG: hypothetical protein Q8Q20_03660 [bacterium]|nr:hypothetical protein [bacterium]
MSRSHLMSPNEGVWRVERFHATSEGLILNSRSGGDLSPKQRSLVVRFLGANLLLEPIRECPVEA